MNIYQSIRNPLDDSIASFFKEFISNNKYQEWMSVFSCFFIFFIVIGIMFLFKKEYRKVGLIIIISFFVAFIFNDLVFKKIISRDRPFIDYNLDFIPGFPISGYSFPSGHSATTSAATFSFLFYYLIINKKIDKINLAYFFIFLIITILVMLSRIALLHHYFTDCLVGFISGIIYALIVVLVYKLILYLLSKRKTKQVKNNN